VQTMRVDTSTVRYGMALGSLYAIDEFFKRFGDEILKLHTGMGR
jgi:hypothetical protein